MIRDVRELSKFKLGERMVPDDAWGETPNVFHLGDVHSIYVSLFWEAYLGSAPFTLYDKLLNFSHAISRGLVGVPTVALLSATMGVGSRHSILGREAAGSRKAQDGALGTLCREGLAVHYKRGRGRHTRHLFDVLPHLPVLTRHQVRRLKPRSRNLHSDFLVAACPGVLTRWRNLEEPSLVPQVAETVGWYRMLEEFPFERRREPTTISDKRKRRILLRDQMLCRYCGDVAEQVDHIIPRNQGGAHDDSNLAAACGQCNMSKGGYRPEQVGMELRPTEYWVERQSDPGRTGEKTEGI